jgi:Cu-Zn family superoxide dismutase
MRSAWRLLALAALVVAALGLVACGGDDSDEGTVSGSFELTGEAPAAYDGLEGEAELIRFDGGTTVSISLAGLEPSTEYISHLHIGGCQPPLVGGPHFRFDPDGSDEPPNEIHLMFSSDAEGAGGTEATSDREVPAGEAGSVVLHPASETKMSAFVHEGHGHPAKLACAELEGPASEAAKAAEVEAAAEEGGADSEAPTIVIAAGEPVGGASELEYSAGDQIRFTVESDVAEEIHVHGYDLSKEVPPEGRVGFSFPAEIEGIFEVEMEARGAQIAELRVNP